MVKISIWSKDKDTLAMGNLHSIVLSLGFAFCLCVFGGAAFSQNVGHTNHSLMMDMHNVAQVMKAYYRSHKKLPSDASSLDELLYSLYKKSSEYNPVKPLPMPNSKGPYRKLGRFQIEFNQNIEQDSNVNILWRQSPPNTWRGPSGTIGIISSGNTKFLVYAIGENGNPIRSGNGQTIYQTYNCHEGTSDERLF